MKKSPFAAPDSFHIIYSLLWGREGHGFAVGCVKGLCKKVGGKGSEGSKGSKGSEGMDCPSGNEYKVSVTGFAFGSSLAHAEMPKASFLRKEVAPQATEDRGVSSFLIFSGLSSGRYVLAILLLILLKVLRKLPLWCLPHHLSPAADKGGGALFPSRYRRGCRVFRRQAEYILIAAKGLGKH